MTPTELDAELQRISAALNSARFALRRAHPDDVKHLRSEIRRLEAEWEPLWAEKRRQRERKGK